MSIDYTATYAALFDRAQIDSDGTALRALLGSGASSIFDAAQLGNISGVVLPWLVWRLGQVSGASGEMRDIQASWWAYIAPTANARKLYQIATQLEVLYGTQGVFDVAGGRLAVTFIGVPRADAALNNLQGMEIRIGFRRL